MSDRMICKLGAADIEHILQNPHLDGAIGIC